MISFLGVRGETETETETETELLAGLENIITPNSGGKLVGLEGLGLGFVYNL